MDNSLLTAVKYTISVDLSDGLVMTVKIRAVNVLCTHLNTDQNKS